ncbi:uncharacterized protein [Drosophila virilis]|uniref:DUF4773 domain-containing protein n=1 Tax=Drosophila virilis TaxID=7244 RepID=B4M5Y2_DROVI|nr:uncharacterized protein LOC6633057 [Drosophila virilis]EDW59058.1 uncharacterized protein Dvir_GJ10667 [Drosophila virilis]
MVNAILSLAKQWHLLALGLGIWLYLVGVGVVQAASASSEDQDMISFPAQCKCSLSMSCNCCQGAVIKSMDVNKTLCMTFKINILKASVDVTITLDNNEVSKFTLDSKTTPSICVPVLSQITPMAICLKMSSKLSGLTSLNMCPSFYSSFSENQLMAFDFPCLKLGTDGISIA